MTFTYFVHRNTFKLFFKFKLKHKHHKITLLRTKTTKRASQSSADFTENVSLYGNTGGFDSSLSLQQEVKRRSICRELY